ncbi:MAG: hypothetical protein JNM68_06685 [Dinghuibacter sp.]|nr:hypothetical protein [Dinghuibacter sp.]
MKLFVMAFSLFLSLGVVAQPRSLADSSFYMVVEDVFDVPHRGLAVVGKVSTGRVRTGALVHLKGFSERPRALTVSSVDKYGVTHSSAGPGDNTGLIFARGVTKADVQRGMVVTDTGFGKLEVLTVAELKLNANAGVTYRDGDMLTLFINGINVPNCELVLPRGETLRPGVKKQVKISFPVHEVLIPNLQIAIMKEYKAIGSGKIVIAE